jgi:thioredoxin reductase
MFDAVVAGAGPAGLSAALTFARARRNVLVADGGPGRNQRSDGVHLLLSRDGMTPASLRLAALAELARYPSVQVREARVTRAGGEPGCFGVTLDDGTPVQAQRLVLATGVRDMLPPVDGLAERWGRGVAHCVYCHASEHSGASLAVLALTPFGLHQALHLTRFSGDVVVCTNAALELRADQRELLARHDVAVREQPIARLEGDGTELRRIAFADGTGIDREVLFCHPPTCQASDLASTLGCEQLPDGSVAVDNPGRTSVPGVFAVGDMARRPDMGRHDRVPVAAAGGVIAAVAVDQELLNVDLFGSPFGPTAGFPGQRVTSPNSHGGPGSCGLPRP